MKRISRPMTRGAASLATMLYALGLVWLAPACPYRATLFVVVGLVLLVHWTLWQPPAPEPLAVRPKARSPRARPREVASRYSQGVLGISTGLYLAGVMRALLH
jgi:hypothetical protein